MSIRDDEEEIRKLPQEMEQHQAAETLAGEPVPAEPQETHETHPHLFIEQRRPDWEWAFGFPVLTNRYLVSHRKRTPEDDPNKTVEYLPPEIPHAEPEKIEWSNLQRTPGGFEGTAQGRQWIGAPQRDEGERRAIPNSDGRHHPVIQGRRVYDEQ